MVRSTNHERLGGHTSEERLEEEIKVAHGLSCLPLGLFFAWAASGAACYLFPNEYTLTLAAGLGPVWVASILLAPHEHEIAEREKKLAHLRQIDLITRQVAANHHHEPFD